MSSNVAMICKECAPKAGHFTGQDPKSFVGKMVKLAFRVKTPDHRETLEHMWVKVLNVSVDDWLRGTLDNDPMMETTYRMGDMVGFQVSEIEAVLDDTPEN